MTYRLTISIDAELLQKALEALNTHANDPSAVSYACGLLEAARDLTPQVDDLLSAQVSKWQKAVTAAEQRAEGYEAEAAVYKDALGRCALYVDKKSDGLHYVFCRDNPLPHQRVG